MFIDFISIATEALILRRTARSVSKDEGVSRVRWTLLRDAASRLLRMRDHAVGCSKASARLP
jgi:hypothetical protein